MPHMERFRELKLRTSDLLELRAKVERKRLLARALSEGEESLPPNLRPVFESMQQQNVTITEQEVAEDESSFWRLLEVLFSDDPNVLQGEIVFIERDESVTAFRHPRDREVPAGLRWHGLRQQRTFCALGDCLVEQGSEPCVLVQLRPREYAGSAGLTVGFKRASTPSP